MKKVVSIAILILFLTLNARSSADTGAFAVPIPVDSKCGCWSEVTVIISPLQIQNMCVNPVLIIPAPDSTKQIEIIGGIFKISGGTVSFTDASGSSPEIGLVYPGAVTSPGFQPAAYNKSGLGSSTAGERIFSIGGGEGRTIMPGKPVVLTSPVPITSGDAWVKVRVRFVITDRL